MFVNCGNLFIDIENKNHYAMNFNSLKMIFKIDNTSVLFRM